MTRLSLVVSLVILVSCGSKNPATMEDTKKSAIMGGTNVVEKSLISQSIVGIYNVKEKYICTGSLIAKSIVMTAAHCVEGRPSELRVVFGVDVDEMMNAREVDYLQEHVRMATDYRANPVYAAKKNEQGEPMDTGDIALIKFKGEAPDGYKPAQFLQDETVLQRGAMVTVAGYGVNEVDAQEVNPKKIPNLEKAIEEGDVVCDDTKTHCFKVEMYGDGILRQAKAPISAVGQTEVILDESKGQGTCSGDSGGPAYIEANGQYYLFGVTSRGGPMCDDVGVYTNALTYKQWVNETAAQLK